MSPTSFCAGVPAVRSLPHENPGKTLRSDPSGIRAAYVGILDPGTTSRLRADTLVHLRPEWQWSLVDTAAPFRQAGRLGRSAAFRLMAGPALRHINGAVAAGIQGKTFDLIWVDKGVFLQPPVMALLRKAAGTLIHMTPDTAFHANRSRHFRQALPLYDVAITTKSFEVDHYRRFLPESKIHLTTQGFDYTLHSPHPRAAERRPEAVFIGLCEPSREQVIATLLERNIPVRLGGQRWERFLERWQNCPHLHFAGPSVFGGSYAKMLSESWIGLGLLSKRFPELHTTRTFEIPACGAVLATESNRETASFFAPGEALFFEDARQLADKIQHLFKNPGTLQPMASAGRARTLRDGRAYQDILGHALELAGFPAPLPLSL